MRATCCISLEDFIMAVSDSVRCAARRVVEEEAPGADLAVTRVTVRFSARLEQRGWPWRKRKGLQLIFHQKKAANFQGELLFSGSGKLLAANMQKYNKEVKGQWD